MLNIKELDDGIVVGVRVQPKASSNRITGLHGDALKVCVTAAPTDGKANKAVVALLAKAFGVKKYDVSIVSGQSSRTKNVEIKNCSKNEILNIINELKKD